MAKSIKLTYFDLPGRGELSRMLLAYGGQPWEDNRISFAEWPELKPKTQLGTLPVLEYNGKKLSQSIAIARFLAKEVGLAGKNNMEQAEADMIVDTIVDVQIELFKNMFEKDPVEKKKQKDKIEKETFPKFLKQMLAILQQSPGAYLVGNDMTWADIALAGFLDAFMDAYHIDGISQFSLIKELKCKVFECANLKAYLAARKA